MEKGDNHSVPKCEFKHHLRLVVDPSISDYSRLFWKCRASAINLQLSRKRVSPQDETQKSERDRFRVFFSVPNFSETFPVPIFLRPVQSQQKKQDGRALREPPEMEKA